jgi:hypothetical protein
MRADIVPGGVFPDYELTDHTKTRRPLDAPPLPRPEPVSRGHAGRGGRPRKCLTGPYEHMGKITVPFVVAQNPDGGN